MVQFVRLYVPLGTITQELKLTETSSLVKIFPLPRVTFHFRTEKSKVGLMAH